MRALKPSFSIATMKQLAIFIGSKRKPIPYSDIDPIASGNWAVVCNRLNEITY